MAAEWKTMTDIEFSLSDDEYEQRLNEQTLIGQDFVEASFTNWLEDTEDYRCPFPERMRDELAQRTLRLFMEWIFQLKNPGAISGEELSVKFGEIIQTVGWSLAESEDEKLSISFPSLPRVGDSVTFRSPAGKVESNGEILRRQLVKTEQGQEMRVTVLLDTGEEYETGFELSSG